jgi:CheY-like chemotaxis protein
VDDNATNRQVLAGLLTSLECRHEEVPDADAALAKLTSAALDGDPFHIAILDMLMPDIDGETLGRLIRENSALEDTALVMMTSSGKRGDAGRLEQTGFVAYLPKPVSQSHLIDTLLTIIGRRPEDTSPPARLITQHTIDEDRKRKIRILLAEDNIINQKVALKMLENMGYHADAVANGLEAVTALKTIPYDLVLMDVQMPEMDGFEVTRVIRDPQSEVSNPDIPVIAMTAHTMKGDREKCLETGMNDYLSKPVQQDELTEIINRWAFHIVSDGHDLPHDLPEESLPVFYKDELLQRLGGDEQMYRELINLFLNDLPCGSGAEDRRNRNTGKP